MLRGSEVNTKGDLGSCSRRTAAAPAVRRRELDWSGSALLDPAGVQGGRSRNSVSATIYRSSGCQLASENQGRRAGMPAEARLLGTALQAKAPQRPPKYRGVGGAGEPVG
jgi:hypothetical protein